jgi:hypothetical protein
MAEAAYTSDMMEAVAVFHDVKTFQAAIDELLIRGRARSAWRPWISD